MTASAPHPSTASPWPSSLRPAALPTSPRSPAVVVGRAGSLGMAAQSVLTGPGGDPASAAGAGTAPPRPRPRRARRQPVVDRRALPRRGRPSPLLDALIDLNGGPSISRRPDRAPALTGRRPRILGRVHCPVCHADDTKVVDSRLAEEGAAVRRRRHCLSCAYRFTTFERVDEVPFVVVKSDGPTQPFDRTRSCSVCGRHQGPIDGAEEQIAESIEDESACRAGEVTASRSGSPCSTGCGLLDEVAYLRFAIVYKNFDGASDFQSELELLSKPAAGDDGPSAPVTQRPNM